MITKDLPVSVYFMTDFEDLEFEIIEEFPGNYDEDDPDGKCFFNTSEEVCRAHFMKACENMAPLLKDRPFSSLSVGIDILGVFSGDASYFSDRSSSLDGEYLFRASNSLLYAYLKNYWEIDFVLSPFNRFIWEHEIVHMLDHDNIVNDKYSFATGLRKYWIKHFLSYRNEGVADLLFTLKGFNTITNMESAHYRFQEDIKAFHEINSELAGYLSSWEKQVQNASHIYSVGPWMILHALSLSDGQYVKDLVTSAINQVSNSMPVSGQTIFELLRYAIELDNNQFISCLTRSGKFGDAYLNSTLINDLNQLLKLNQPKKTNK